MAEGQKEQLLLPPEKEKGTEGAIAYRGKMSGGVTKFFTDILSPHQNFTRFIYPRPKLLPEILYGN